MSSPAALASAQSTGGRSGLLPHVAGQGHRIRLEAGERFEAGTCGLEGARAVGDTVLRLRSPGGQEVVSNDDGCLGSYGSRLSYHVPADGGGVYVLAAECFGAHAKCDGQIVYRVESRAQTGGLPRGPAPLRVSTAARGLVDAEGAGGALLADTVIEGEVTDWLTLRVEAGPLGLGGGAPGGLLGGSALASVVIDLDGIAFGAGAGVGALGFRDINGEAQREAAVLGMRLRLGDRTGFQVAGELRGAVIAGGVRTYAVRAEARLPLGDVDLVARGAGGDDGVALGELAVVIWLDRAPDRPVFGLSLHAGGGGVFYQPLCRFGRACDGTRWLAGPLLGAGMEWRP